jgi:putative endopeptidase
MHLTLPQPQTRTSVRKPLLALACALTAATALAQTPAVPAKPEPPPPAFDLSAMDNSANPCDDFYKFACGNFAATHPIPADQTGVDQFHLLYNANTVRLNDILTQYAKPESSRSPNQQKIGDFYAACMNTSQIDQQDLKPIQPMLDEIDNVSLFGLPLLIGKLQRVGVNAFLNYGEEQDFKDATRQVATIDQGGLGLPERDYYTRTGPKDVELRTQYVKHVTNVLSFLGESPQRAMADASAILAFETKLAKASMTVTDRRDPMNVYHPQTMAEFQKSIGVPFAPFFEGIHSPKVDSLINANPAFFPAMIAAIKQTPLPVLRAYLKYHLATTFAANLPDRIDNENFHFYGTIMQGQPEQRARWKRCSAGVDKDLGEALGQVYVEKYFAGDSKAQVLQMVHDIESAMDNDIDTIDWMSPETKVKAKQKLHLTANKIGYPDKWRDYSRLTISPTEAFDNQARAEAFENDRELNKIGKPVDKNDWGMTPPTVNAYYNPSMNDINFPAGILQPAFYDAKSHDIAVNYGHMGAVIGHELTHGFDDEGSQFNGLGNMTDWWTPEDKAKFETRTSCLVNEYGSFTAVDNVKINGKLTLGENTADNGGAVLSYMAYLDRAKKDGIDTNAKTDGFTGPQRFYIAFAQNWCENSRPEIIRQHVQTDPHSPDHFRANGVVVNQPGFAAAFSCKKGSPMVPNDSCRVW